MKISISSAWAREYTRKRGGVLNIAWRLICVD